MSYRHALSCAIIFGFCGASAFAQLTERDLSVSLKDKTYFLRGLYTDDKLEFGVNGQAKAVYKAGPFLACGIQLKHVHLTDTQLQLEGVRTAFVVSSHAHRYNPVTDALKSIPLEERVSIVLDRRPGEDSILQSALSSILASGIDADLVRSLPEYWRGYFAAIVPPPSPASGQNHAQALRQGVTRPSVLYSADPEYSDAARKAGINGSTLIAFVLDSSGIPRDFSVVAPLGAGLDEQAIAAIRHYRFQPASYQGHAVPYSMSIKVDFLKY